jgi:UDP-glucose 4-epimerase
VARVLLTGGAGFVGANLARALLEEGTEVRVLDDLSAAGAGYLRGLPLDIRKGDVTDQATVRRAARGTDAIVHLAAQSGVAPSVARPDRDFDINVRGTFNVVDAARREGVARVVFASSGAVLAGARPPLHEELPASPLSPYGASKLYGEGVVRAFEVFGIVGVSLRFSNVYGPLSSHKKSVVAAFLRRTLRHRPFIVYGTGRQTRDFLYVSDVAEAVKRALGATRGGVYQLGTGVETSVLSLARLVADVVGVPFEVERRPTRPGEAARNVSDISLAQKALRWKPRVGLREGLALTLGWMRGAGRGVPSR